MSDKQELIDAIRTAIGAHGVWKLRLKTALNTGKTDLQPDVLCRDDQCEFGRWLYGPTIPAEVRSGPCYEDVRKKHADFHKTLSDIVGEHLKGNSEASKKLLEGAFEEKSKILTHKMQSWVQELRA